MAIRDYVGASTQILWSGLSFLLAVLLARYLPIEEFGWYAIAAVVRQFLLIPLGALVLTPLTVLSPLQAGEAERIALEGAVFDIFRMVSVALFGIIVLCGFLFHIPGIALAIFMIGGIAVEFQRRIHFIHGRVGHDLVGGVTNCIGVIAVFAVLKVLGHFNLEYIFLAIGSIGFLWAIVSAWYQWRRLPNGIDRGVLGRMWKVGGWVLAGHVSGYIYAQASTFLTLFIVGAAGVAVLELARQFVAFVQVIIIGMSNFMQPKIAHSAAHEGSGEFARLVWRVTMVQTGIGAVLMLAVLIAAPYLLPYLFPGKEPIFGITVLVAWILSAAMLFQLLWQHLSFSVVALGKPEYGFWSRTLTGILLVPLGYVLTEVLQVPGAAWTRVIGEGIFLILSFAAFMRAFNAHRRGSDGEENYVAIDQGRG